MYGPEPEQFGKTSLRIMKPKKTLTKSGGVVQTMTFDDSALESWMKEEVFPFLRQNKCSSRDVTRQSTYLDLGTNGGQAHNTRSDIGISIPSWYAATFEKETKAPSAFVYNLFGTLTDVVDKFCPFVWEGMEDERLDAFARKIHPRNRIEAVRLATVWFGADEARTRENMCHMHVDRKNDSTFSQVVVLSTVVWDDGTSGNDGTNSGNDRTNSGNDGTNGNDNGSGTNTGSNDDEFVSSSHRLSIIMYTRQSITNYLIRQNVTMGPALNKIVEVFGQIHENELHRTDPRALMEYVKQQAPSGEALGRKWHDFQCHLDPAIFMSPVVSAIAMLNVRFRLDFVETVSVLRGFGGIPNTPHYFVMVVLMLLKNDKLPVRGVLLGKTILRLMKKLLRCKSPKEKTPGLRFSRYMPIEIPDDDEWSEQVRRMSCYALCAYEMDEYTTNKDNQYIVYGETLNEWVKVMPNVASLIGNHLLGIAALVGILPAWFFDCFLLSGVNLPLEYFRDNYNILTTTGHLRMLLESVAVAIESKFGIHVSCRKAENIICKVFRVLNPNTEESIYRDHHIEDLPALCSTKYAHSQD